MHFKINDKIIGPNYKTHIVAELSGNHNGNLKQLIKLIDIAKQTGADSIKIQLYNPDTITVNSNNPDFQISKNNKWYKYKNLYNLYKNAATPLIWADDIFDYCQKKKINLFTSVFDLDSLKILKKKGCPAYKIASNEITDIPLIDAVSKTKKPIILSTGMAEKKDLDLAVRQIKKNKNNKLAILKCSSSYPTPFDEINLKTMIDIKKRYNCIIGLSDHSPGYLAPIAATVLGASIIEKHIVKDKKTKTVDSFFSMSPKEFKTMIEKIRLIESTLGKIEYNVTKSVKENFKGRRSLYVIKKIKKGNKFTKNNIKSIRPGHGLHPRYYWDVIGKKSTENLNIGDRLKWSYIEKK